MRSVGNFLERFGVHHPTFAVCICQFGSTILHTTFMFYYVKIFLNVYRVNERWFDVAQALFLVWNALNDPLFGYLQNLNNNWMRNRRKVILYGSPFFALSFLIPWFPWTTDGPNWVIGIHLIVSLYIYDGMFSFVLLAWCSLFAEITTDHSNRVRAVKYMQIAILLGVNVLTVMDKASKSLSDLRAFQMCSVLVALVAFCCFYYTGRYSQDNVAQVEKYNKLVEQQKQQEYQKQQNKQKIPTYTNGYAVDLNQADEDDEIPSALTKFFHPETVTIIKNNWRISMEILKNMDFQRFVWMNFLCVCRSTMHMNFAAIFTERLIPTTILPLGSWRISFFYGFCAAFPQVLVIGGSCLVNKYGSYKLMMSSFYLSVASGLVMYFIGVDYPVCIMLFMLFDSVTVHTFTPLTNILCADLIDNDMVTYKRSSPVSSILFGLNALICKPGISLAPMMVVYFLDLYGYDYLKKGLTTEITVVEDVRNCMFVLLCLAPVVLGSLQWLAFRNYSLRTTHLPKDTPF